MRTIPPPGRAEAHAIASVSNPFYPITSFVGLPVLLDVCGRTCGLVVQLFGVGWAEVVPFNGAGVLLHSGWLLGKRTERLG